MGIDVERKHIISFVEIQKLVGDVNKLFVERWKDPTYETLKKNKHSMKTSSLEALSISFKRRSKESEDLWIIFSSFLILQYALIQIGSVPI